MGWDLRTGVHFFQIKTKIPLTTKEELENTQKTGNPVSSDEFRKVLIASPTPGEKTGSF
jgi:hypothetical protein